MKKDLKALELLKNALKDEPDDIFEGMEDEEAREYVLDAIRELERLKDILWEKDRKLEELNNRSCDGCKYEAEKDCKGNFITVCKRFPRLTDRYEKKDSE